MTMNTFSSFMMITSMIIIKGGKSYFFLASIPLFRVSTSSQGSFIIVTFPSQLLLSSSSSIRPIDHNHHDDSQICLQRSQYTHQQNFICKVSFTYCLFFADFILFSESNFRDQIRMHRSQGKVCKTHRNYICIHGSLVCFSLCILQLVHLYSGITPYKPV